MILALLARLVLADPAVSPVTDLFATGDEPAASAPAPAPVGPPSLGNMPPEVVEAATAARDLPLAERMKAVSEPLMERPYEADPLGEGDGIDPDPFARYDAFDCLTFVEEVLSLSLAGDPAHAAPVRLGLRYGQQDPSYATRRHFMELQWIPGSIADGWVVDTTAEYGEVTRLEREVTAETWKAWKRRGNFALTDEELPVGVMHLDVLSLDEALKAVDDIRPGTIVLTVRQDRPWIPIWISHVGFVLPGGEETMVRHATRMKSARKVRDHRLAWYIDHLRTYSNWPAVGIALLEPVEQGPRRTRVPGTQ